MSTRAKPQNSTHTHTHTHTHTDSFLKSLKQIGTICLTISLFTIPNFASADNIPTTNPGCTTTVLGAQNIANGSASLEPDFSANTINTTWYSNGTQLTGNGIPATCTYDAALTPPTPAARPGYVFGGWRLRVPACNIPSTSVLAYGTTGIMQEYKSDSTGPRGAFVAGDLIEDNTWRITTLIDAFHTGDKVTGEAFCSTTNDGKSWYQTGDPGTIGGYAVGGQYCWCRATHYTTDSGSQCTFSSPVWVFYNDLMSADDCAHDCAYYCAYNARNTSNFRATLFTGLIAQ